MFGRSPGASTLESAVIPCPLGHAALETPLHFRARARLAPPHQRRHLPLLSALLQQEIARGIVSLCPIPPLLHMYTPHRRLRVPLRAFLRIRGWKCLLRRVAHVHSRRRRSGHWQCARIGSTPRTGLRYHSMEDSPGYRAEDTPTVNALSGSAASGVRPVDRTAPPTPSTCKNIVPSVLPSLATSHTRSNTSLGCRSIS